MLACSKAKEMDKKLKQPYSSTADIQLILSSFNWAGVSSKRNICCRQPWEREMERKRKGRENKVLNVRARCIALHGISPSLSIADVSLLYVDIHSL